MRYKLESFESSVTASFVNKSNLCQLSWNGIPNKYRATCWKILCGYLPANLSRRESAIKRKRHEYMDFASKFHSYSSSLNPETLRQVQVDLPRTAPTLEIFQDARVRQCLERLLFTWAMRHPAASYVQGINDLITPLFVVFVSDECSDGDVDAFLLDDRDHSDLSVASSILQISTESLENVEADCYWCLTSILVRIQDHYTPDQPGIQRMVHQLEDIMTQINEELCDHLSRNGVAFITFAFRWMNCLLIRELSLKCIIRMWDSHLSEGGDGFENFHVYVCAALLDCFSEDLKRLTEFEDLISFLQKLPTSEWGKNEIEMLLSQAFVFRNLPNGKKAESPMCPKVASLSNGNAYSEVDFFSSVTEAISRKRSLYMASIAGMSRMMNDVGFLFYG
eukprot:CAMPEP_0195530962 /NCGR_PEP_ID=MMETSP0794_2-20130614/34089_1 /TAXON_ID=515487 /ORGANISM="Stephanopyxis turris, Strain CCMP 815" /LENGTH=392 /DNA_ID=CAMNT_0040662589 /DNA_START=152 /DNA_END=1329 /DNA_ORIENTATION=+